MKVRKGTNKTKRNKKKKADPTGTSVLIPGCLDAEEAVKSLKTRERKDT